MQHPLAAGPAPHDRTGAVVTCALAAISETDMMLLGVRDYGRAGPQTRRTPRRAGRPSIRWPS